MNDNITGANANTGAAKGAGAVPGGSAGTKLECSGLNEIKLDVTILYPEHAVDRNLLHLEADPLPVQFTGMTGSAGSAESRGMPAIGGGQFDAP